MLLDCRNLDDYKRIPVCEWLESVEGVQECSSCGFGRFGSIRNWIKVLHFFIMGAETGC